MKFTKQILMLFFLFLNNFQKNIIFKTPFFQETKMYSLVPILFKQMKQKIKNIEFFIDNQTIKNKNENISQNTHWKGL